MNAFEPNLRLKPMKWVDSVRRVQVSCRVVYVLALTSVLTGGLTESAIGVSVTDPEGNGSFLAVPDGQGSFRAVLYNHGGAGNQLGGDPELVAKRLADAGFIAYSKRRSGESIPATLAEVQSGIDELLSFSEAELGAGNSIDMTDGISLIGYSRGGLMVLRVAELKATKTQPVTIDKVIVMAAAPGELGEADQWVEGGATDPDDATTMDTYLVPEKLETIDPSTTEFFLLAANNDQPPDNPHNNLVDLVSTAHNRLVNRSGTPVPSTLKIYDDWEYGPPDDPSGHFVFESVEDGGQRLRTQPGYYWLDVIRHLKGQEVTTDNSLIGDSSDGGVELSVEICDDGEDNDEDGDTDCADGNCADDPSCAVDVGPFIRGDCDGNGTVGRSPTEAVVLLSFAFRGGDEPPCLAACDAEANGSLGITDALRILRHSFLGLGTPDPPFPDCVASNMKSDLVLGCKTPQVCR